MTNNKELNFILFESIDSDVNKIIVENKFFIDSRINSVCKKHDIESIISVDLVRLNNIDSPLILDFLTNKDYISGKVHDVKFNLFCSRDLKILFLLIYKVGAMYALLTKRYTRLFLEDLLNNLEEYTVSMKINNQNYKNDLIDFILDINSRCCTI